MLPVQCPNPNCTQSGVTMKTLAMVADPGKNVFTRLLYYFGVSEADFGRTMLTYGLILLSTELIWAAYGPIALVMYAIFVLDLKIVKWETVHPEPHSSEK